jgi:hypothetical protein
MNLQSVVTKIFTIGAGLAEYPGKIIYGNNAGFFNNLNSLRKLKIYRHAFPISNSCKKSQSLREHGYQPLPRTANIEHLQAIKEKFEEAILDDRMSVAIPSGTGRHILNPVKTLPAIEDLVSHEVCQLINAYYGCAFKIKTVRSWRNCWVAERFPGKEDFYSNTFHNDKTEVTGLRLFVLLTENVTRETGGTRFYDKPTTKSILRSLQYFHRNLMPPWFRISLLQRPDMKVFEGTLGDMCLLNVQECLHAAGIPREGTHRDIIQFEIYPAAGPQKSVAELIGQLEPDKDLARFQKIAAP